MCFWLCKGVFRGASPELVHTPLGCGFGFWVSKSDARYCCGHTFSPVFAGLPECRFSVPAPEFHRSVAVLAPIKKRSSHSHIPSSRSLSCSRLSGNKKSRHTNAYQLPAKRIDLSLAVWLHIHVTGFVIQSRNCHLRLTTADSSEQFWKRRYFSLAYRRRCPALSRSLNKICENIFSCRTDKLLLYII